MLEPARETRESAPAAGPRPVARPRTPVELVMRLQQTAGNRAVARLLGAPERSTAPTVAYPPELLAACPSLRGSGAAETPTGRPSLEALADAARAAGAAKADFVGKRRALFSRDLSATVSQEQLDKIQKATAPTTADKDPLGHAARGSTEHAEHVLSTYADHRSELEQAVSDVDSDDRALQNANAKLRNLQNEFQRKQLQDDKAKLEQSGFLAYLNTVLSQIGQGLIGEGMKLLAAKLLEDTPAFIGGGTGKPPTQGTLVAMGLEDLSAGTGGVLFLTGNAIGSLLDRITTVEARRNELNTKIAQLTVEIDKGTWQAAVEEIWIAAQRCRARHQRLTELKGLLETDKTQLDQAYASLGADVDAKAGVSVFSDTRAALQAASDADAAADAAIKAIAALKAACEPAAVALAPAQDLVRDAVPHYDGADAAREVRAVAAAQDAEAASVEGDKLTIAYDRTQLEKRLGTAYDAAVAGL